MKFLTLIIASFLLFLAVKPGIDTLFVQADTAQSCCGGQRTPASDDDKPQDQHRNNDCDGTSCNPFQVCRCCVVGCVKIPSDFLPDPAACALKGSTSQSAPASLFASDVWHPPRIF